MDPKLKQNGTFEAVVEVAPMAPADAVKTLRDTEITLRDALNEIEHGQNDFFNDDDYRDELAGKVARALNLVKLVIEGNAIDIGQPPRTVVQVLRPDELARKELEKMWREHAEAKADARTFKTFVDRANTMLDKLGAPALEDVLTHDRLALRIESIAKK